MRAFLAFFAIILAISVPHMPAIAQGEDIVPEPIWRDLTDADFLGVWNYKTADHKVAGRCPNGKPMSGTMTISPAGESLAFQITGAVCNPTKLCSLKGRVLDKVTVLALTSTVVDDEGGHVISGFTLRFNTEKHGAGNALQVYEHPEGFACEWTNTFEVWRDD